MLQIKGLHDLTEVKRREVVLSMLSNLSKDECYVYVKLITGGFRINLADRILVDSISQYCNSPKTFVAHQLADKWTPDTVSFKDYFQSSNSEKHISTPFCFHSIEIADKTLSKYEDALDWSLEWD